MNINMIRTQKTKIILAALLALVGGITAQAQTGRNGVPGNGDYAQFNRFITDRNIFDPNRYPRNGTPRTQVVRTRTRTRTAARRT